MWSFNFPKQILHGTTEKEWFPRSDDEKESRFVCFLWCAQPANRHELAAALVHAWGLIIRVSCKHSQTYSRSILFVRRLDALEREEEAQQTRMRKIAQTKAKAPIGVATKSKQGGATASVSTTTQVDMSVIEPQPRPRIWNNLTTPETPREAQATAQSMVLDDSASLGDSSGSYL